MISANMVQHNTKRIFAGYGKGFLVEAKRRFQAESSEITYHSPSGSRQRVDYREGKDGKLYRYVHTLAEIENEKIAQTFK